PFTVIAPRRSRGDGKTHVDGGWDCYLERYLYVSIKPSPYTLFGSTEMPPNGQNFYYVDDKEIDRSLLAVANSLQDADRLKAYHRLYEYRSWQDKTLIPALAAGHTMSDDGKHWVVTLRQGVKWHSGEELTAADVKFTWDIILNKGYGSPLQATCARVFGDANA